MNDEATEQRETRGRMLLNEWLAAPGRSQIALSGATGISQGLISQWTRGIGRPGTDARDILERACGIPRGTWRTPSEQAAIDRVSAITAEAA